MQLEQLGLRSFPALQELAFKDCTPFCNGMLVHAADLPSLRQVKFEQASPASGESAEVVCALELAARGLGKSDVLCVTNKTDALLGLFKEFRLFNPAFI